jgi:hypothetical protein
MLAHDVPLLRTAPSAGAASDFCLSNTWLYRAHTFRQPASPNRNRRIEAARAKDGRGMRLGSREEMGEHATTCGDGAMSNRCDRHGSISTM